MEITREKIAELRAKYEARFTNSSVHREYRRLRDGAFPALLDLAERALEQEWRPIAEAPKDGTRVLMWSTREADDMLPQIIKWLDGQWVIGWDHTPATIGGVLEQPTHWMPLPESPK